MRSSVLLLTVAAALRGAKKEVKPVQTALVSDVPNVAHSLLSLLRRADSPVPFEEFLPDCVQHVEQLISTVKHQYSDAQLESVLESECSHAEAFPLTHGAGFRETESCKSLATKLAAARAKQRETGSQVPLESWCESYYEHSYGPVVAAPKPAAKSSDRKSVV